MISVSQSPHCAPQELHANNRAVDETNCREMERLPSPPMRFIAVDGVEATSPSLQPLLEHHGRGRGRPGAP